MAKFEGSAKDVKEDKILAKKNKMSMSDWEKSPKDAKHDKQKSMKGLKKGGITSMDAKKMGRNVARAMNQKSSGRGR
jgi:hypothetical protein